MRGGAPAYVIEFDTATVSFEQSVLVLLTNTGQDDTSAVLSLTAALGSSGLGAQEVGVDLPAGETTETALDFGTKGGNTGWLSILSMSDQVVPTAIFYNYGSTEVAQYLPGDFAIFNLLGGRTRIG